MSSTTQLLLVSILSFSQLVAQQKGLLQPPPPRDVTVTAIPRVIDAGAKWTLVWQGTENADGIAGTDDGGLLFAQEQTNRINSLDKNGKFSVYLSNPQWRGNCKIALLSVFSGANDITSLREESRVSSPGIVAVGSLFQEVEVVRLPRMPSPGQTSPCGGKQVTAMSSNCMGRTSSRPSSRAHRRPRLLHSPSPPDGIHDEGEVRIHTANYSRGLLQSLGHPFGEEELRQALPPP
jgi:hypothetical protein